MNPYRAPLGLNPPCSVGSISAQEMRQRLANAWDEGYRRALVDRGLILPPSLANKNANKREENNNGE